MLIDKTYHVWKCCDTGPYRPTLQYVKVERVGDGSDGIAVAADGFCLVVVPVVLDQNDAPGLVYWEHLADAKKHQTDKKSDAHTIHLEGDTVTYPNGAALPRKLSEVGEFPDWLRIVDSLRTGEPVSLGSSVALNQELLAQLVKAMGVPSGAPIHITAKDADSPVLIETVIRGIKDNQPQPPYGVLMPMAGPENTRRSTWPAKLP